MGCGGFHVLKGRGIFQHAAESLDSKDFRGRADAGRWGEHQPISQHLGRLIPGCPGHAATAHFGEEKEHPPCPCLPSAPGGLQMEQQTAQNRAVCKHGMDAVTKHGQRSPARRTHGGLTPYFACLAASLP